MVILWWFIVLQCFPAEASTVGREIVLNSVGKQGPLGLENIEYLTFYSEWCYWSRGLAVSNVTNHYEVD